MPARWSGLKPCAPKARWCRGKGRPEAGPDSPITDELIDRLGACGIVCVGGNAPDETCGLRQALHTELTARAIQDSVRRNGGILLAATVTGVAQEAILEDGASPNDFFPPVDSRDEAMRQWRLRHISPLPAQD